MTDWIINQSLHNWTIWIASAAAVAVFVGCGDPNGGDERVRAVDQDVCDSEQQWVGGEAGSELMHPGGNCLRCHADNPGAPVFLFAGTVYGQQDADDGCFGVEGATVTVSDASGASVEMRTNAAGNFYVEADEAPTLETPYFATVQYEGREATMEEPLYSPNCVDCHDGGSGGRVPPRIVIPSAD